LQDQKKTDLPAVMAEAATIMEIVIIKIDTKFIFD
jgi:hypothetical protein